MEAGTRGAADGGRRTADGQEEPFPDLTPPSGNGVEPPPDATVPDPASDADTRASTNAREAVTPNDHAATAAPPSAVRRPPSAAFDSSWQESLRFLGSLKFFIPTIILLAGGVALGTFVDPQTYPQWLQKHPEYAGLSRALGLPDVYHSFWFMSLLTAFFLNLSACTWLRRNRVEDAFRTVFGKLNKVPGMPANLPKRPIGNSSPEQVRAALQRLGYRPIVTSNGQGIRVYADKGRIGLLGPWVTHIGILLTLTGGFIGGLFGFTSYAEGIDGEAFSWPMVVRNMSARPRVWPRWSKDWQIKVNTFWIEFDERRQPKQFYSDLSVLQSGQETHREKIWVNKPLAFQGMLWYQSNWGVGGLDLFINGRTETVKVINWPQGGWLARWPASGKLRYVLYFTDARGPFFLFSNKGQPLAELPKGLQRQFGKDIMMVRRTILKTGLQIGYDPGYPLVATGFFILGLGVMLAWFSHRQIWIALPNGGPGWAAGKARKARFALENDLKRLLRDLAGPARQPLQQAPAVPSPHRGRGLG